MCSMGRMAVSVPQMFVAGVLEAGQVCPCCQEPIRDGQRVGRCPACQHLQHEMCWQRAGACRSYECQGATAPASRPDLVITADDVSKAKVQISPAELAASRAEPPPVETRLSKLAVTAFVLSLVGAVCFGVPGLLAVVLGAVAIGAINTRRDLRGTGFAGAAIVIGVVAVVGWGAAGTAFLVSRESLFGGHGAPVNPPQREFVQPSDMDAVPAPIRRAICANVLIVTRKGLGSAEGSGVILEQRGGQALIITNRHVIEGGGNIEVTFFDGRRAPAKVAWHAPTGVDAAVLTCDPGDSPIELVPVRVEPEVMISETVFAIGNPVGLAWSYASGAVSAIRKQSYGSGTLRMIQTQTPLNPGNSGGGLYDEHGNLVGINTMIMGRQGTQGIGFAIAIVDLIAFLDNQAGLKLQKVKAPANRT